MREYVPRKGDFVRLNFDPQSGHEQKGWRPGLVVSNRTFNAVTGFSVVCPITTTNRKYPFHVTITAPCELSGVIMVDQAKALDFRARKMVYVAKASSELLEEVMARHEAIFQDEP